MIPFIELNLNQTVGHHQQATITVLDLSFHIKRVLAGE
jgi:hypothetical protein